MDLQFFINAAAFGFGLAMDAFSVSMANGLNEPCMRRYKMAVIAGVFAVFQFLMPLIGWFCVHTVANMFAAFRKFIPWIALALLLYIGGKMLIEGIKNKDCESAGCCENKSLALGALLVQGVATSIDALSVGFTIANYALYEAVIECLIIGVLTFIICYIGIVIGKTFGTKLAGKASILGGAVLIFIGIEIFITGI